MPTVQQPTQLNPQAGLDTGAIGAMPMADSAAQTAMPTADNPNITPLLSPLGVGQSFTLSPGQQIGAQQALRFTDKPPMEDVRTEIGTDEYGNKMYASETQARTPDHWAVGRGRNPNLLVSPPGRRTPHANDYALWLSPNGEYVQAGGAGDKYFKSSDLRGQSTLPRGDARAGMMGNGFKQGTEDAFQPVRAMSPLPGTNSIPGLSGRQINRRMLNPDIPAYAEGGMVGQPPNGQPGLMPQGAPQGYTDPKLADAQIDDMLVRNPQVKQQIQQAIQQAIQSGELNPQMAQMAVQLAQACIQNPALYPQLRQFAVQRGLADATDLPEQYDQGLVLTILIAAKAATGMEQGQQPQAQGQALSGGGVIVGPGTGTSDSVPAVNTSNGSQVKVSNGEYVIPKAVVDAKGKDFFDSLVRKYHTPNGYQQGDA